MTTTLSDLTFEEKIGLRSNDTSHIEFNFGDATFSGGKIANISVGGTDYRLSEGSFRQIAEHLSIPVPFARRVPSDLIEAFDVSYPTAMKAINDRPGVFTKVARGQFA